MIGFMMNAKAMRKAAKKSNFSYAANKSTAPKSTMNSYKISVDVEEMTLVALLTFNNCPKAASTVKLENGLATCTLEGNVSAVMIKQFLIQTGFEFKITPIAGSHDINKVQIIDNGTGPMTSMIFA